MKSAALALALMVAAIPCLARAPRSHAAKLEFQRHHPCPATGRLRGACPGYVIDHRVPLCAGGVDEPSNMQWQTIEAGAIKDRFEWEQCRLSRRAKAGK